MIRFNCAVVLLSVPLLASVVPADDDRPIPIDRPEAVYPKKAYNKCIEGHVLVRFIIATDGTTKDIEVLSSRPANVFEKAAVEAVKKWRFEPRTINGVPVQREETQRLVFEPGCTS